MWKGIGSIQIHSSVWIGGERMMNGPHPDHPWSPPRSITSIFYERISVALFPTGRVEWSASPPRGSVAPSKSQRQMNWENRGNPIGSDPSADLMIPAPTPPSARRSPSSLSSPLLYYVVTIHSPLSIPFKIISFSINTKFKPAEIWICSCNLWSNLQRDEIMWSDKAH